jgi:hypothetical protein
MDWCFGRYIKENSPKDMWPCPAFTQHVFIEHKPYARHCSRLWRYISE